VRNSPKTRNQADSFVGHEPTLLTKLSVKGFGNVFDKVSEF